ncbi:MAG: D-alanyl-D-alanine carboxypeptidase/D-alanyl-D-alanine-endopeptidase, partial [Planctomycetota bacterium]
LVVVGRGDPQRVSSEADSLADLRRWAHLVAQLGIREVRGDLVGDDRYFAGPMRLADWPKQQWHRWYSAPCGALNLNDNCFDVTIAGNGESIVTSVFPETGLVTVDNQLTPVKDAKRHVYSIDRTPGSWTVVLRGRFLNPRSPLTEWVTIEDPTLAYVGALRYLLEESGVRVTGDVRRGAAPPDARLVDRVAHSIASYVPRLIKKSMNLHGDCLLRHFGRRGGSDGSFVQSAMAAESLLKERFGWNGPITMRDGSGLSHQNRINARDVVTLLRTVEDKPWGSILIDALPVAGKDGTLARRFRRSSVAGRVRAKTGHISGVTSLVGYLDTKAGRVTFAVLFNGPRSKVGKADRWHETLLEAVDASVAADSAAGRRGVK